MNHVGTQKLETDRLVLRRYAKDDAQIMRGLYEAQTGIIKEYVMHVIMGCLKQRDSYSQWCIIELDNFKSIGLLKILR